MRLLFINYEFPPLGGGGGNANAQIAKQIAGMGHEVVVLTSSFKGLPRHEKRDGYSIYRIPSLRRYMEKCRIFEMTAFMLASMVMGPLFARKWKPDRTIAFFTIPSGPSAWIIKKLFHIPYLVSLRGGDVPGFMHPQLKLFHRLTSRVIRFLWHEAHAVVANSEGLKRLALKTTDTIDIMTIPNGVDAHFFNPDGRGVEQGMLSSPSDDKVDKVDKQDKKIIRIMTAGRLTSQKGIDTLLFAFWRLKPQLHRPVQIWIVGDGPRRQSLEQLTADLKLEDDVFFLGWRDRETLKNLYSSADLFALPSLDEGMSNVLLEAMAMGLPVVATEVSGVHELVKPGENGFLVPPQKPDIMAQHLMTLINEDSLRQNMSKKARHQAQYFDWQAVARGYLELCETLP